MWEDGKRRILGAGFPFLKRDTRALWTVARDKSCTFLCIFPTHFGPLVAQRRQVKLVEARRSRADVIRSRKSAAKTL
jgi:hypothetical protein